jgi:hypothetical protein
VHDSGDGQVHFGHVANGMIQGIARGRIHVLLTLHGTLHDSVMRLERLDIVGITFKDFLFDALAQAVFGNRLDDFRAMLLLGINPLHFTFNGK